MAKVLQVLRGTTAKRTAYTPKAGELIFDTDKNTLFVGNGSAAGGVIVGSSGWEDWYSKITSSITSITPGTAFKKADVYVDGAIQIPGYNYSISQNVIKFTTTLAAGSLIYCKLYA